MSDRRETRRDPVVTTVGGHTFEASPVPWQKRNDLGDALVRQYSSAFNNTLRSLRNDGGEIIGIEGTLFEAGIDYPALFELGYSTYAYDPDSDSLTATPPPAALRGAFRTLVFDDMLEVLIGALKANGLERLEHMLDPDRKKDLATGDDSQAETVDGQKTALPTDFGSLSQDGHEDE